MNKVAGQNGGFWGVRRGGVGGTRDREREKKNEAREPFRWVGVGGKRGGGIFFPLLWLLHL